MRDSVKITTNNKEVIIATDESLRHITDDYHKVIVKYIDEDCTICKVLAPPYKRYAADDKYMEIQFVTIDTFGEENGIAKNSVLGKLLPFFMTYKDGLLIHNSSFSKEKEIVVMLDELVKL